MSHLFLKLTLPLMVFKYFIHSSEFFLLLGELRSRNSCFLLLVTIVPRLTFVVKLHRGCVSTCFLLVAAVLRLRKHKQVKWSKVGKDTIQWKMMANG